MLTETVESEFERYLKHSFSEIDPAIEKVVLNELKLALKPDEIRDFLNRIKKIPEKQDKNFTTRLGYFITRLMQNSHQDRHNKFELDTEGIIINNLGYRLEGTRLRPLSLTINGDIGDLTASFSSHLIVAINGNAGNSTNSTSRFSNTTVNGNVGFGTAYAAGYTKVTVNGNVGPYFGYRSMDSTGIITGNISEGCGLSSKNITITISQDVKSPCGTHSELGIYYIKDRNVFERLKKEIPKNNNVHLINSTGEIIGTRNRSIFQYK